MESAASHLRRIVLFQSISLPFGRNPHAYR